MLYKIRKTLEILKKKWFKSTIEAVYYYFTIKIKNIRKKLSYKYIQWNGIEIWWLDNPTPINHLTTKVKYVDYIDEDILLKNSQIELGTARVKKIDYICKADNLNKILSDSQDFVIANHLFEHLENPIKALLERYRVIKKWWTIFMAIPDKRKTFDENRKRTTLEHIISDYKNPSEDRDREHYLDYAGIKFSDPSQIEKEAKRLKSMDFKIHYHVFVEEDITNIINRCNKNTHTEFNMIHIKHTTKNPADNEFIFILEIVK